jgi:hypothetical protein
VRNTSTSDSFKVGEVSRLAVFETVAMGILSVLLAVKIDNIFHIVVGALVAPLFLFSTAYSQRLGVRWYVRLTGMKRALPKLFVPGLLTYVAVATAIDWQFAEYIGTYPYVPLESLPSGLAACLWGVMLGIFIMWGIVAFASFPIRFASTFVGLAKYPMQTLKRVPRTWWKMIFCSDVLRPPEPVPGARSAIVRGQVEQTPLFRADSGLSTWLLYVPSLALRLLFKASCLLWLPLFFSSQRTLRHKFSLEFELNRIRDGDIEKVRKSLAKVVGAAGIAKLTYQLGFSRDLDVKILNLSDHVLQPIIVPLEWPAWQVLLIINVAITWCLHLVAGETLSRIKAREHQFAAAHVETGVMALRFSRSLASWAAIGLLLYSTVGLL